MRWNKPRGKLLVTHFAQRHTGDFNDTGQGHQQRMRAAQIHLTPPAFAAQLVALARACGRPSSSACDGVPGAAPFVGGVSQQR
jgi:hypothetical protein